VSSLTATSWNFVFHRKLDLAIELPADEVQHLPHPWSAA